jgi:hypothetical protein
VSSARYEVNSYIFYVDEFLLQRVKCLMCRCLNKMLQLSEYHYCFGDCHINRGFLYLFSVSPSKCWDSTKNLATASFRIHYL